MNDRKRILRYLLMDFASAFLAWQIFNVFRYNTFRLTIQFESLTDFLTDDKVLWMSLLIPVFWLVVYFLSGYYAAPRRKTNLGDLLHTALTTLIGVLIIFFAVVVNDYPKDPSLYYEILAGFFLIHFLGTSLFRLLQTVPLIISQSKGRNNIPVFVIGTGENAERIRQEFNRSRSSFCYRLEGFIQVGHEEKVHVPEAEIVGNLESLPSLVDRFRVEELIFALDVRHPDKIQKVLDAVYDLFLPVKAFASRQDILSGKVSLMSLFGIPMVNLTPMLMPVWQSNIKWLFDKIISAVLLVFLSPFFLYLSVRVRLNSPGRIFYVQERVGKGGRIFHIYKFRTMYIDAESDGPKLSDIDDARVTSYGRFMRKYRLDELPQFWNVLKGDMSMVGPRPERQFFVKQIVEKAPHYYLTQRVLPGITSWGMVKYGYANTVEKMIRRLEYDIIYLENQSLLIDVKILVFTLKPLIKGKGQ
jgi:exopolysaccharide biosynthesis polyprenyl glycosylphosphotransferase